MLLHNNLTRVFNKFLEDHTKPYVTNHTHLLGDPKEFRMAIIHRYKERAAFITKQNHR